jgi:uncharacterized protein YqkB
MPTLCEVKAGQIYVKGYKKIFFENFLSLASKPEEKNFQPPALI